MAIKKRSRDSRTPATAPGICSVCLCTAEEGCPEGCDWADKAQTLCTACESLAPAERIVKRFERMHELEMRFGELMLELSLFHQRFAVAMAAPLTPMANV